MSFVRNTFGTLESICSKTFGPSGVGALLETPSGFLTITRSGWAIIQCISEQNKENSFNERILLRNAENIQKIMGDGVKSFVLLEIAFLKFLEQIRVDNMLTNLTIFKELNNLLRKVSEIVAEDNEHSFLNREDSLKATSALFYTSCPENISFLLQNVFHEWFHKSLSSLVVSDKNLNLASHLQFLLKHFNLLCLRNNSSGATTDSYVLPGYLIDRIALNLLKKEEHVLAILYVQSQNVEDSDISREVNLLISENTTSTGFRKLIISCTVFSDKLLFDLMLENVIVLHGVKKDDIDFIASALSFNDHKVKHFLKIKVCIVGNTKYTHLLLPTTFQLVICAPTTPLANEYISICRRALKLLLTITSFPFGFGLIKGGGSFERALHFQIAEEINQVDNPLMSNISDRKTLMLWHHQRQLRKCRFVQNKTIDVKPNKIVTSCCSQSKAIKSGIPEGKILGRDEIDNVYFPSFKKVDKSVLSSFIRALSSISNHRGYENSSNVFEPLAIKIMMLQYVLTSAIQIFKTDQSISFVHS